MRSAMHTTFGEPSDVLSLGSLPKPEPAAGEVRIQTLLAPIHNHDLWTIRGRYGYKPELPAIGGSEAVGMVEALGPDVEGVTVGQRVAVAGVHGTWAEYFLAPARQLVPVPDAIPDDVAAQLIAMPLSALMLLEFLQVAPGQWIAQNTANGAVGKTLAMLASARGVHVLNLVRRDAGVQELSGLGSPMCCRPHRTAGSKAPALCWVRAAPMRPLIRSAERPAPRCWHCWARAAPWCHSAPWRASRCRSTRAR